MLPRTRTLLPLVVVVLAVTALLPSASATASGTSWRWPLGDGAGSSVGRRFEPPRHAYGPGHRGIDLPGTPGEAVLAVAPGRVTFVGHVAGVPVVSVTHGRERSTYQPVHAEVRRGDAVQAGDRLGVLLGEGSHCLGACLHLGRVAAGTSTGATGEPVYLDPEDALLQRSRFRLVDPDGPPPQPPTLTAGSLGRPVPGPVTSPFGMRVHPITGVRKLHDGTDLGAPCGTPVRAAASGRVERVETVGGYGRLVVIAHDGDVETAYAHLSASRVSAGQPVSAGQVVGLVGRTGYATGCHLHFMVVRSGRPVDPMSDALTEPGGDRG